MLELTYNLAVFDHVDGFIQEHRRAIPREQLGRERIRQQYKERSAKDHYLEARGNQTAADGKGIQLDLTDCEITGLSRCPYD